MIAVLRQGYGGRSPLVIFMDFPDQVYILKCADGHMYVGCTGDLAERMGRHAKRPVHYTGSRLPVQCIAAFGFIDKSKVFNFEKYLKTGSGQISPHAWYSI
jgi:predicted GIY-YIG superfamily endonuclease